MAVIPELHQPSLGRSEARAPAEAGEVQFEIHVQPAHAALARHGGRARHER
ncbi:hypothetical protein WMF33_16670 [Sorangium sp. So ce394]